MSVIVPPGFALAVWRFALAGDPEEMLTTCGVDVSGIGGAYVVAANGLNSALLNQFAASAIDSDWTLRGVRLYVGQDGGATVPYDSTNGTRTGTSSDSGPIQNTALLVRKATALPGRKGRGRMFWPPFMIGPASYSPAGVLTSTTQTNLQTKFSAMLTAIDAAPDVGDLVLLHSDATAPTPITALTVQQTLATQRQRLRR